MAPNILWSMGPNCTQVHYQENGIRCSGVGSGTWSEFVGAPQLLYPVMTPPLALYGCQRRDGGVATLRTISNRHYLSGTGVRPVP